MKLLILGKPESVFIVDYVKWLKKSMKVDVHVFPIDPLTKNVEELPYDYVYKTPYYGSLWSKIPYVRRFFFPLIMRKSFSQQVASSNNFYDIIHIHHIDSFWVIRPSEYKKYARKLYLSFWGTEWKNGRLFNSNALFRWGLKGLLRESDRLVQTSDKPKNALTMIERSCGEKFRFGYFGSSSLDDMHKILHSIPKNTIKEELGVPSERVLVGIGYSGKQIHQHAKIINYLRENYYFLCDKIYLIIPMTYDYNLDYVEKVRSALDSSGFEYSLLVGSRSTLEIAKLRIATDVFLQLSTTDAASRSVLEYLCSGCMVIYGDWINYQYFFDEGFKLWPCSSFKLACDLLSSYIANRNDYSSFLQENIENGDGKYSWSSAIETWVGCYKEGLY